MAGLADADAHEVFDVRRFGEGAEVESDDGFFEPLAGGGGDGGAGAGTPAEGGKTGSFQPLYCIPRNE